MCGILGYSSLEKINESKKVIKQLFLLSETRGKEASGFAVNNGLSIRYLKTPYPASQLVKSNVFDLQINNLLQNNNRLSNIIGHSRLVTNGYENDNKNNQPVRVNDLVLVHNGIIVNHNELWNEIGLEKKKSDLDTEVLPWLIEKHNKEKRNIASAIEASFNDIVGMTSIAAYSASDNNLYLASNNGSLYYNKSIDGKHFIFASERYILETTINSLNDNLFSKNEIKQVDPKTVVCLNLVTHDIYDTNSIEQYSKSDNIKKPKETKEIIELNEIISKRKIHINKSLEHNTEIVPNKLQEVVQNCQDKILALKRCTKCILPSTFPFIEFDLKGVCNYCNNYKPLSFKGEKLFAQDLDEAKINIKSHHDCLVPFSGGRDSSYALHYIKKELKLNPIAFSYDWGMLTDLARRNQSRMCGELGVEHILISADIRKKRANIRKNVVAWLKRPHLGTIPLFMAGDKQYFYFANLLMKQNNLNLSIMGENMLETTRFKTGFCGISPKFDGQHTYTLSSLDKLKMISFYGKEYILNPSYINSSLLDTFDAFKSYYIMKHQNINIFDYLKWDEKVVDDVLINQYNWEIDPETKTTWRIGDGTAAFYNYIYLLVAGFTENDTFRSNQIREGQLSRDKALSLTIDNNQPRWGAIQWYCKVIGIDWKETIQKINSIKRLY